MVILSLTFSCHEENGPKYPCSVENPARNLSWLADQIREWENSTWGRFAYVTQATLDKETVFIFRNCCPYCDSVVFVYDCAGNQIGVVGKTDDVGNEYLDNEKVIWKSENSVCTI